MLNLFGMMAFAAVGNAVEWCVLPGTVQILQNYTCFTLPYAAKTIDLAGMQGERESVQILLRVPASASPMTLAGIGVQLPGTTSTVRQVGYVNCSYNPREPGSGGGWRPDPLLPLEPKGTTLLPGVATPLWLTIGLPADDQRSGELNGTVALSFADAGIASIRIPAKANVWPLRLPSPLELHKSFGEIWSFDLGNVKQVYAADHTPLTDLRFQAMMTDALLPPDALYKHAPYANLSNYSYLASSGAYLLNLGDIGTDGPGCPTNYSEAEVAATLATLKPAFDFIARLDPTGKSTRPYVYGYDEQPESCEHNIRVVRDDGTASPPPALCSARVAPPRLSPRLVSLALSFGRPTPRRDSCTAQSRRRGRTPRPSPRSTGRAGCRLTCLSISTCSSTRTSTARGAARGGSEASSSSSTTASSRTPSSTSTPLSSTTGRRGGSCTGWRC
jgi:hypothetical protein